MAKELIGLHEVVDELTNGIPKFVIVFTSDLQDVKAALTSFMPLGAIYDYAHDVNTYRIFSYDETCEEFKYIQTMYNCLYLGPVEGDVDD